MPAGICTVASRESMPLSASLFIGTPSTGSDCVRRDHAREVSRAAGRGNDDFNAASSCARGKLGRQLRRAMSRHDAAFVRDAKLGQRLVGVAHGFPVRLAAHDDGDEWCGFRISEFEFREFSKP